LTYEGILNGHWPQHLVVYKLQGFYCAAKTSGPQRGDKSILASFKLPVLGMMAKPAAFRLRINAFTTEYICGLN